MRVRRTRFYLSANNIELINEALASGVDGIVFDLEDLCPLVEKDAGRLITKYALLEADFGNKEKMVRINGLSSPFWQEDLELIKYKPDTILYPKAESAAEMERLDQLLTLKEQEAGLPLGSVKVIPALETAFGLMHAYQIATASDRIEAISIGGADMAKDLKAKKNGDGKEIFVAKSILVLAARAAGVQVLDTVYPIAADEEGLKRETWESLNLGFDGKGVISANQVSVIHDIFTPSNQEYEEALNILKAVEEAARQGGAQMPEMGGKLLDSAVVEGARRTIAFAEINKAS